MLFRQDLGWRHDRGLYATGNSLETRYRRDDRFAGTDVALDKAHHRMRLRQIAENLIDHASLRPGQRKGQVRDKATDLFTTVFKRYGIVCLCQRAEVAQAQVMGEQLFESEALLARVFAGLHLFHVRIRRRSMNGPRVSSRPRKRLPATSIWSQRLRS